MTARRAVSLVGLVLAVAGLLAVLVHRPTATPSGWPPSGPAAIDEDVARQLAEARLWTVQEATPRAPLTGVEITEEEAAELEERPAYIVKIPNNELAHPHTGLEDADVVYEQETEGGTTRFAAVWHSTLPEVVGNIRSARFVDVPIVAPYDGVFVFAGARGEVLDTIEAADLTTVGAGGPGYFIVDHRNPPHHLYSRPHEALAERDASAPDPSPWRFDEEPPDGGRAIEEPVRVLMSHIAATTWDYDEEAGVFRRLQNDRPHEVTGEGRIGAANVVLLDVPVPERDSHNAPVYDLEGEGDALLLREGRAYDVRWTKGGEREPLDLRAGDDEAVLAPGPTWVMLTYDGTIDDLDLGG